ncbi:MAG: signal peptidase II [Acutalibacteraceae bacterium]|nr:signal peptidase II [Acutalibacteraceae bacterium]
MKKYKIPIVFSLIVLLVVGFDQLTKFLAVTYLEPVGRVEIIKGVLNFTYVENPGAVGGIFADSPWVFNVITVLAVAGLTVAAFLGKFNKSKWLASAVAFIVGGGIGNLIDRFFRIGASGYHVVVDFIDVVFIPVWKLVFNIADSFVVVGCIMIILHCVREFIIELKSKKEDK